PSRPAGTRRTAAVLSTGERTRPRPGRPIRPVLWPPGRRRRVRGAAMSVQAILDKAAAGERLTYDEGVRLFDCHDLSALGRAADAVTQRLHPEPYRTYNIDRNINYTNVCAAVCDFCAFYRKSGDADAYVLPREELY